MPVFSCNLPLQLWQDDKDILSATAVAISSSMGMEDTEIRASTESQPWRWNFTCCFYRDLNMQPFDHKSGALPPSYSHSPVLSI